MLFHFFERLQRSCEHCFFTFYRRRAARKQYLCHFIVVARRGNNIFAILSSPRGAGTIFMPFYRHRAARKQYLCRFIVAAQRGNNIYAILSSPHSAETISLPFYRRRVAREQYFRVSVLAASLRALKFLFSPLQNGGTCWNGRGGACVPARTSAQRRFHPKMRCCHPQTLRFHLRKARFHLQTRCFYPQKAPPNDGCTLAGCAGRHTGTATTTLDDDFGHVPAKSFII